MDDLKLYAWNEKEPDALLISTIKIYSKDYCLELGISKCPYIALQRGKVMCEGGLQESNGQCIDKLDGERDIYF